MRSIPDRQLAQEVEAYLRLRRAWARDIERYVRDRFGQRPTQQQRQILHAVKPGAKVTVRSGHGTGKTTSAAWSVWWWLETSEYPRIPCTAPTSHQLRDVLWAELHKWVRKADEVSRARGEPEALWLSRLFSALTDRIYDPDAPSEWFAVARTSKRENPDALQGFHASDMQISEDGQAVEAHGDGGSLLFVVDEASGIPDTVFEVAEGALSSPTATLLMLGNPVRRSGYFAESHLRDSGFERIHLRSSDSPLVDPQFRDRLAQRWGEDSNVVRVRADGEFPLQDDDVLIPYEAAEAALTREPYEASGVHRKLGIDVARYGSDRTVLTVRAGRNVERIQVLSQRDTMEVAGASAEMARASRVDAIYVDTGAMGSGVADRLRELVGIRVVDVEFGAAAPARGPVDEAQGRLMRDYLWIQVAQWLKYEDPSLAQAARRDAQVAEDLVAELTETRYRIDSSGRLQIESKDEAARRGVSSPDLADSLITTFAPGGEGPRVASAGRRSAPASITRRHR